MADNTVFVGSYDSNLYAVDTETGSEKWSFETGGWIESSPMVVEDTVFVGNMDTHIYAVDVDTDTLH